jgi:hypothetical protein
MARCTATAKSTGKQCGREAILGSNVCFNHGGAAPQVKAAAERRLAKEVIGKQLDEALEELGATTDDDPASVLLEAVAHASRMRRVLAAAVGSLSIESTSLYGPDHLGDARPHVLELMLREWSDRATRYAKLAIDAGFEERRVRVAEETGHQLAGVLSGVLEGIHRELVAGGVAVELVRRLWADRVPELVRQVVIDVVGEEDAA